MKCLDLAALNSGKVMGRDLSKNTVDATGSCGILKRIFRTENGYYGYCRNAEFPGQCGSRCLTQSPLLTEYLQRKLKISRLMD